MENLKNYKNQIEEVQNLVSELENGTLSKEDLSKLELLTRMIHERSIILKYMAFGDVSLDSKKETIVVEEEETITPEVPVEKKVEIDLFGDFSKNNNEEDEVETPLSIMDIMDDLQKEEPNFVNEIIEKEIEEKIVDELEKQEVKEEVLEKMQEIDLTEKVVEEMEEIEITEKVVNAMDDVTTEPIENNSFLDQLNLSDDSLHSVLNASKIETLVGAFSLNEKLRFMNDLFDGSSEDFNESVRELDQQEGKDTANSKINELASRFDWDSEDEAVTEFVSFINRRYA